MSGDLDDSVALVTGASAGIGRATARELAGEGASVALLARSADRLADLAATIEDESAVEAIDLPTDVSDPDAVDRAVDRAVEALGGLDVVVSNAGVGQTDPTEELSTEDFRRMMGVNVEGAFFLTRATLPHLREAAGNLVFIGSTAGRYLEPMHPAYAASKWWVRGFAANLAGQAGVGDADVGVTVINPTAVRTEFGADFREPNEEVFEAGRVLEPEDVAEAVAFAARQDAPKTVHELDLVRRNEFSAVDRFPGT